LVGIVGPIGSGKSSLLDAISFALYGKTPTIASATRSLIHQRAADGAVALRFEVDGEVWEAARLLRVKGQSQHALYRFETDSGHAEPIETITQEAEVNAKVVELLGLEFDAFRRSVLLAQGQFAEFLSARPAERDKVLKGVFGHDRIDRMRVVAKARSGELAVEIEKVALRVEHLERVAERIAEHEAALALAAQRLEVLEKAAPKVEDFDRNLAEATSLVEVLEAQRTELQRHAGRLPDRTTTKALLEEAAGAAQRRSELAELLEQAQEDVAVKEAAVAELERAGTQDAIERAAALQAEAKPLEKAVNDLEARRAALTKRSADLDGDRLRAEASAAAADQEVAEAVAAAAEAAAGCEAAELALHAAEHAGMAIVLRAELAAGAPCPVCAQEVIEVPEPAPALDLGLAEAEVARARDTRDSAEAVRTATVVDQRGSAERLSAIREAIAATAAQEEAVVGELEEAHAAMLAGRRELANLVGDEDPARGLEMLRGKLRHVNAAAVDARKAADRVRRDHDQAIRDEQGTAREVAQLRLELADLAARLDVDADIGESPADLGRGLDELRRMWDKRTAELSDEVEAAKLARSTAAAGRSELLDDVNVTGDFGVAVAEVRAQIELRTVELKRDEAEVAAADELRRGHERLVADQERYRRITSDLTDSRFVRFLLDEERASLAELGSDHFQRLTSGRYRFSDGGGFDIVDLTAADAERKSGSLSGGETFLASLALALALAEMVARTGGRLDSFFLDEGFGALDPEHLDLAMEGIETLVAGDQERLVVVVSHVPELRHRIEDLIELDRDPTTGDTRVVSA
jgi:exonuclease SbcC